MRPDAGREAALDAGAYLIGDHLDIARSRARLQNGLTVRTGPVPAGPGQRQVIEGKRESSLSTVDGHLLAQKLTDGVTLVLSKDLISTQAVLTRLAWVFGIIGGCGAILAGVAGTTVAQAGLRPVDTPPDPGGRKR